MSQIFISYAHKDGSELAEFLHQRLSGCGYEVFKDDHDLRPGDTVMRAISNAIDGTGDFIVLMTRAALSSNWVSDEVDMAMTVRRRVISIVAEDVNDSELPPHQRKLLYIRMKNGALHWQDLHRLVNSLDGGSEIPRVYNMSKYPIEKVSGLLVLGNSETPDPDPTDPDDIRKKSKKLWKDALPFLSLDTKLIGFVPNGWAPLASAFLALWVGKPNGLFLRMYYTYKVQGGKYGISADKFVDLEELREFARKSH